MSYNSLLEEKRSLYEILGVAKTADASEIKRAYRKKALRLHPDKNPSAEAHAEFLKVNAAYEILKNERARQTYDRFGLQMAILVVDPQAAQPGSVSTMLGQLGLLERCSILMVITIVLGMVVVAPIFISLRWDSTIDWDWTAVFIPLWVWEAILLVCCVCFTHDKVFGTAPDDEDLKREFWSARIGAIYFFYTLVSFAVFQGFLAARLDGNVDWNYTVVFAPWIQWEAVSILYKFATSRSDFIEKRVQLMAGPEPERERQVRESSVLSTPGFYVFLVETVMWSAARLILALLIAAKWNGDLDASYWEVFGPLWAVAAVSLFFTLLRCVGFTFDMEHEMPQGVDPEEAAAIKFRTRIVQGVCMVLCLLVPIVALISLAAAKAEGENISAVYIFLPIFIYAGCTCLCLGCLFCCFTGAPGGPGSAYEEQTNAEQGDFGAGSGGQPGESSAPYARAEEGRAPEAATSAPAPAAAAAGGDDEDIDDID